MAKGTFNIAPVVSRWWAADGRSHPLAYLLIPAGAAAAVAVADVEAVRFGALETGSIFLSGILLTIMFQVYGWAATAAGAIEDPAIGAAWEREVQRRRLQKIGRLYDTLTWATLVSFALTIGLVILSTTAPRTHLVLWTSILTAVGTHLVIVLLAVVNRLFAITRNVVDEASPSK